MVEDAIHKLGLTLPPFPTPAGNYVPCVRVGNLIYISGMLPTEDGLVVAEGPVGVNCTLEEAQKAAARCALNVLAVVREAASTFDNVERVVQVQGFVWGENGFSQAPQVINGASDLLVATLGDRGRHTRMAVTVAGLPLKAAVEITAIVQLRG